MMENTIQLPDGRRLGYAEYVRSDGTPVITMHGTPGARFDSSGMDQMVNDGSVPALRIFALERSGYGLSDPHPGRTIDRVVEDTVFFADVMELNHFALCAFSGGAPFALACSQRIPQRILKTAIIAGLGPVYIPELLEGVSKEELKYLQSAIDAPQVIIDFSEKVYHDPASFVEQLFAQMPEEYRKQITCRCNRYHCPDGE